MSIVAEILQVAALTLNMVAFVSFLAAFIPGVRPLSAEPGNWFAGGFTLLTVAALIRGAYGSATLSGALAVLYIVASRRGRRNGKRAAKALGEKSRALIAALVARVRESARPRPVLKPQPGGAS